MDSSRARTRELPGMSRMAGPAGACLINNTNIWHTNTPNDTDQPRRVIWLLYKPSHDEMKSTAEYLERQTNARRRALMGLID